jgi:protein phosphatase
VPSIEVSAPGVVVLVGAAGSGKTTLARRLFEADEILSSDELRGAIRGDPTDQSLTRVAFGILHRELLRRLARRRLVVVDATSLTGSSRAAILRRAHVAGVRTTAVVLLLPPEVVHARNAGRASGVVPRDVVDRQLAAAAGLGTDASAVVQRLLAEGFSSVHVLTSSDELDRVMLRRIPARRRPSVEQSAAQPGGAAGDQGDRDRGHDDPDEVAP